MWGSEKDGDDDVEITTDELLKKVQKSTLEMLKELLQNATVSQREPDDASGRNTIYLVDQEQLLKNIDAKLEEFNPAPEWRCPKCNMRAVLREKGAGILRCFKCGKNLVRVD